MIYRYRRLKLCSCGRIYARVEKQSHPVPILSRVVDTCHTCDKCIYHKTITSAITTKCCDIERRLNGCVITQQTRDIDPILIQCWASVEDDGPVLIQEWVDVFCTLLLTL